MISFLWLLMKRTNMHAHELRIDWDVFFSYDWIVNNVVRGGLLTATLESLDEYMLSHLLTYFATLRPNWTRVALERSSNNLFPSPRVGST